MATTPVTLKVDGFKEREVLGFNYSFEQATDQEGQMSGIPRGGKITIRCKAYNDGNPDLLKWMLSPYLHKDGEIIFNDTIKGEKMKSIAFKKGYCVNFTESWEDNEGHTEEIEISCQEIACGPVKFENAWK
ncbi:hypothetical protein LJC68_00210 [Bacteroidales bacterium OttesenSCG-928-B11]|nr:hypothetical protein [Bacteroidales bacterium OttesenSCG-928-E04]MDL2308423.1 hypothetical protein [Bacteroidales bacterium OttesenSCG-928-C03]MDL2311287.1 hypothetical protein [Bacteroidales bacterium OttesenSCG-928-B11]MDL2326413.1 hypothetical protein [Bacteroidales bacterium OttesenSCG-928-A14]